MVSLWLRDQLGSEQGRLTVPLKRLSWKAWQRVVRSWHPTSAEAVLNSLVDDLSALPSYQQVLLEKHVWAAARYQPAGYAGCVSLFRTEGMALLRAHEPALGWERLAQRVAIHRIPGAHYNILQQPYVEALAAKLAQALKDTQMTLAQDHQTV